MSDKENLDAVFVKAAISSGVYCLQSFGMGFTGAAGGTEDFLIVAIVKITYGVVGALQMAKEIGDGADYLLVFMYDELLASGLSIILLVYYFTLFYFKFQDPEEQEEKQK